MENPYYQARISEMHRGWTGPNIPNPETEEEMELTRNKENLLEWIMDTEEMRYALMLFRGGNPENPDRENHIQAWRMNEEEVYETDIAKLLLDLTAAESDWR